MDSEKLETLDDKIKPENNSKKIRNLRIKMKAKKKREKKKQKK